MIPFHPLAEAFPLMEGAAFHELVADIDANGLAESIVFLDGHILDGRNRYRALVRIFGEQEADRLARRHGDTYRGGRALEFVISKNLHRRHLDRSQCAMVAARLATLKQGYRKPADDSGVASTQAEAGALAGVSARLVRCAVMVRDKGTPELRAAVEQGHLAVTVAAPATKLPPTQQREIAAKAVAGEANVVRTVVKQARREQRERELGARQQKLPERKYGVIVADPEWRFDVFSRETGLDRAADNHYPTSDLDAIKRRDVASIAADDCVLWLWATVPMLAHAIEVMQAWGFAYKSHVVWRKDEIGNGYWFRNIHEILLVGTRGNPPAPAPGTQPLSVIVAERGAHSAKPVEFLEIVERYYPTLPKIELNRRGPPRPGWDAWGLEAEEAAV